MKDYGIVRQTDPLGRIVIPLEVLEIRDIQHGDKVEITSNGSEIFINKHADKCEVCRGIKELKDFKNKRICLGCISYIKVNL